MNHQQLDQFLQAYTSSEQRHLAEDPPRLSHRYALIQKVVHDGREMYQFNFDSLMQGRTVCIHKESRFTVIPEHIHSVIELLYVYSGCCTQIIHEKSISMQQGDICMLDTGVPHSIAYLGKEDIIITIEIKKEYLTQGFLQRLGNNSIINGFLMNALSSRAAHDEYLLFRRQAENPIHTVMQNILCEFYDPQVCTDNMIDAYMIVLFCEILRQYRSQSDSSHARSQWRIVDILDYLENNYLTASLQSTAEHFGFHPNYLSALIKRETGRTFKELVILQRMCQACFYLTNTDLPVYEIAQKVGYDNLGFFYHKFEALYHTTPQQFRLRQEFRHSPV